MSKRGVEISDRETGQRYEVTNNKCTHPGCGGVIIQSIGGDPVCISCGRPAPAERPAAAVQQAVKPTPETVKPPDISKIIPLLNANGTPATESKPAEPATPPAKKNTLKRSVEIESQAVAIIFDYNAGMGTKDILGKYKISGCAWHNFKKRHAEDFNKHPDKDTSTFANMDFKPNFPPFPAFDSKWAEPVQMAWLECYTEIVKVKNGRV